MDTNTYIAFYALCYSIAFLLLITIVPKIIEAASNRSERIRKEQKTLEDINKSLKQMSEDIKTICYEAEKAGRQIRTTGGH